MLRGGGGRHLFTVSYFLPTHRNIMCISVVLFSELHKTLYQSLAVTALEISDAAFFFVLLKFCILFLNSRTLFASTFCKACLKSLFLFCFVT